MMVGNDRADAVYTAISASNPNMSKLSADEVQKMKDGYRTIYGADTTYIQTNAEADPGTFNVPSGVPVATTGTAVAQTGATTAPGPLSGKGTIA